MRYYSNEQRKITATRLVITAICLYLRDGVNVIQSLFEFENFNADLSAAGRHFH